MSGELCGRCGHAAGNDDVLHERGHFPDLAGRCVTNGCRCPAWVDPVVAPDADEARFLQAMSSAVVAFCRELHPHEKGGYGAATPLEMIRLAEYIRRMVAYAQSDLGLDIDARIPP